MKKLALFVSSLILVCGAAMAQNNDMMNPPQGMDENRIAQAATERMAQKYGLDSRQEAKLLKLNKKYAGKIGPMMGGRGDRGPQMNGQRPDGNGQMGQGHRPQMNGQRPDGNGQMGQGRRPQMNGQRPDGGDMEQMHKNVEKYNKKMKKILTDSQYQQYLKDRR